MAKYDVHALRGGSRLVLDCQTDLLRDLNTRFVVPLFPETEAPQPAARLNPVFRIRGDAYVMVTQFASAIPVRELGERVCSLAEREYDIGNALDMLIIGF
jgi:toxin CcdB